MKLNYFSKAALLGAALFLGTSAIAQDGSIYYSTQGTSVISPESTGPYVGIGVNNPDRGLEVAGADFRSGTLKARVSNDVGVQSPGYVMFKTRGTVAAPTPVAQGDRLGFFLAGGRNAAGAAAFGAGITFLVDGPVAGADVPTNIAFETGPNFAARSARLLLGSDGTINLPDFAGTGDRGLGVNANGDLIIGGATGGAGEWTLTSGAVHPNDPVNTRVVLGDPAATGNPNAVLSAWGNSGIGIFGQDTSVGGAGIIGVNENPTTAGDGTGILGSANTWDWWGFGAIGQGGYAGFRGIVLPLGQAGNDYYGVQGIAAGGTGAADGSANIGVYGFATGASTTQNGGNLEGNWAVYADGESYSTVAWTASDRQLKSNIAPLSNALDMIASLQPKSYEFKKGNAVNAPTGQAHYGFMAQELKQVIPHAVKTTRTPGIDKTTFEKTNNYSTFDAVNLDNVIAVLVKGMQEQQAIIEAQQEQIDALTNAVSTQLDKQGATLNTNQVFQSFPNPAISTTNISYTVKSPSTLNVYNAQTGALVKSYNVTGKGQVTVDVTNFAAGSYTYSIEGSKLTKTFVVAK